MVRFESKLNLPTSDELPCSDDTPVDNENQNFIPNFLLFLLEFIWQNRQNWFFAVDMAIYHTTGVSPLVPVVPDGFLSLGVERRKSGGSRKSYVVWEENDIVPIFALEIVSLTPGGEYDNKMAIYANLGVLYYLVYNPEYWQRDRHQPFELYRLFNREYQQQIGEPFWMPEIGLSIGRSTTQTGGLQREVLSWYNQQAVRYLTPEEQLVLYRERFGELPDIGNG
jgi:Uma2 family endonuclease